MEPGVRKETKHNSKNQKENDKMSQNPVIRPPGSIPQSSQQYNWVNNPANQPKLSLDTQSNPKLAELVNRYTNKPSLNLPPNTQSPQFRPNSPQNIPHNLPQNRAPLQQSPLHNQGIPPQRQLNKPQISTSPSPRPNSPLNVNNLQSQNIPNSLPQNVNNVQSQLQGAQSHQQARPQLPVYSQNPTQGNSNQRQLNTPPRNINFMQSQPQPPNKAAANSPQNMNNMRPQPQLQRQVNPQSAASQPFQSNSPNNMNNIHTNPQMQRQVNSQNFPAPSQPTLKNTPNNMQNIHPNPQVQRLNPQLQQTNPQIPHPNPQIQRHLNPQNFPAPSQPTLK